MIYSLSQTPTLFPIFYDKLLSSLKSIPFLRTFGSFLFLQIFLCGLVFAMDDPDRTHVKTPPKKKDEGSEFLTLQQLDQAHSHLHPDPPYTNHTLTEEELATIEQMHDLLHEEPQEVSPTMAQFHEQLHDERQKLLDNRANTYH